MKAKQVLALVFVALCGVAQAGSITFEDGNYGVTAADNMSITTNYSSAGVTFRTGAYGDTNYGSFAGSAYLEKMGNDADTGFNYNGSTADTVSTNAGSNALDGLNQSARNTLMGSYFLRTASLVGDSLAVLYGAAVSEASFELWDLDGVSSDKAERWSIKAYNGDWLTPVLSQQTAMIDNDYDVSSYDGQVLVIGLSGATFDRFVIEFTGTKTDEVGLAFNNFNSTEAVPEPASVAMIALGGLLIAGYRRIHESI
jgi:hypothetical protein